MFLEESNIFSAFNLEASFFNVKLSYAKLNLHKPSAPSAEFIKSMY